MSRRRTRDAGGENAPEKRAGQRWIIPTAAAVLVVATGAAVAYLLIPTQREKSVDDTREVVVSTRTVERRDLTETVSAQGTLDYGGQHPLTGELGGTVTWLPQAGDVVDRGGRLFSIDNAPVILMFGKLPAWRRFEVGMTDGPDVKQLEDNLAALGFFGGTQTGTSTGSPERRCATGASRSIWAETAMSSSVESCSSPSRPESAPWTCPSVTEAARARSS